jgi:hypothetical protein
MELLEQSDFRLVSEYRDLLWQDEAIELSGDERELIASGAHPRVGLFLHRITEEPQLRLLEGARKGTILGQFATRVIPHALAHVVEYPMDDESMAAYRRNVFSVVGEFRTSLMPKEFTVEEQDKSE